MPRTGPIGYLRKTTSHGSHESEVIDAFSPALHAGTGCGVLVVVAILGLLAGLGIPAINNGLEAGRSAKCVSKLRTIGTAVQAFATARRDLSELEKTGRIQRTPGGALARFTSRFPSFSERLALEGPAKQGLARQVLPYLLSGFTVYIDGGTTPYALARLLPEAEIPGLRVVTNSLPVVEFLASTPVSVHILGGDMVPRQSLLIGSHAVRAMQGWKFDVAVLGAEGITRQGVWNSVPEVVALQRAAMAQTRQSFLLLSADKIGRSTSCLLGSLAKNFRLVTDATPPQLAAQKISTAFVQGARP